MSQLVVRTGKGVQLIWNLTTIDALMLPALVQKYVDPPTLPTVTIFDPTGAIQVNAQATTKLAPGFYAYPFTTPSDASVANGKLGIWKAWLDLVDAASVPSGSVDALDQQKATPVFQVV